MKVCFPVERQDGLASTVFGHFGTAPAFVIVDTEREGAEAVANSDLKHDHGLCNPIMAMGGVAVNAVVVGGIGAGALRRLNAEGIRVFRAAAGTVRENLALLAAGTLPELAMHHACGGHGESCGHH